MNRPFLPRGSATVFATVLRAAVVVVPMVGCATSPPLPPVAVGSFKPLFDPALPPLDNDDPLAGCTITAHEGGRKELRCGALIGTYIAEATGDRGLYESTTLSAMRLAMKKAELRDEAADIEVGDRALPGRRFGAFVGDRLFMEGSVVRVGDAGPLLVCANPVRNDNWNRCRGLLGALAAGPPADGVHPLRVLGHDVPVSPECTLVARNRLQCPGDVELHWGPAKDGPTDDSEAAFDQKLRDGGFVVERPATTDCALAGAPARCVARAIRQGEAPAFRMVQIRSAAAEVSCLGPTSLTQHPLCHGLVDEELATPTTTPSAAP